jgi:hypothetical protein
MNNLSIEDRFWQKVQKTASCWLWTASKFKGKGYGQFQVNGSPKRAHRVSWEFHRGPIPEGLQVLHECDNQSCVNPDHLFLGTQLANMQDKVAKNRQARGHQNGRAKMTWSEVRDARAAHLLGESYSAIAKRLGVGKTTIALMLNGITWKELPCG